MADSEPLGTLTVNDVPGVEPAPDGRSRKLAIVAGSAVGGGVGAAILIPGGATVGR